MCMATVENYIESQYRLIVDHINIEYLNLYKSFSNEKLQEIFSTIQHLFVVNYSAMNDRLPTGDYGNHYWANNSRELILAIEVLRGLERVLKTTKYAFLVDPYYEQIITKSMEFLVKSGGSQIPPHMDKIVIYYTEPIFIKKNSVKISSAPVEQQYADLKQIGKGSYATVYYYYDSFYNRKYVLKRAKNDLNEKELLRFKNEYKQMSNLHSPYIVEVYSLNNDTNEYIMEYMDCTLADYIINSKPDIKERKRIVYQVLRAFNYIHSKRLLHRDISPNNILVKKYDDVNVIKISDFGLVKLPDSTLTSYATSVKGAFNDPALDSEGYANYSIEDETYALTRIVLYIITGSAMIESDTDKKLKAFLQKGVSSDRMERYHSVEEMKIALKNIL